MAFDAASRASFASAASRASARSIAASSRGFAYFNSPSCILTCSAKALLRARGVR